MVTSFFSHMCNSLSNSIYCAGDCKKLNYKTISVIWMPYLYTQKILKINGEECKSFKEDLEYVMFKGATYVYHCKWLYSCTYLFAGCFQVRMVLFMLIHILSNVVLQFLHCVMYVSVKCDVNTYSCKWNNDVC